MINKLVRLTIFGVLFAFVFAFGTYAQAQQIRVDRDFGSFHMNDVNQFGDDRAYNSTSGGTDRDADFRLFHWTPNTYGLMGDYGYDSNGAG